jgi:hypothetical protein
MKRTWIVPLVLMSLVLAAASTFFGVSTGQNSTGTGNSFFGSFAGYSNTTGSDNTAIGYVALFNNTTGNYNAALGIGSGVNSTTGSFNIFLGAGVHRLSVQESRNDRLLHCICDDHRRVIHAGSSFIDPAPIPQRLWQDA